MYLDGEELDKLNGEGDNEEPAEELDELNEEGEDEKPGGEELGGSLLRQVNESWHQTRYQVIFCLRLDCH